MTLTNSNDVSVDIIEVIDVDGDIKHIYRGSCK